MHGALTNSVPLLVNGAEFRPWPAVGTTLHICVCREDRYIAYTAFRTFGFSRVFLETF